MMHFVTRTRQLGSECIVFGRSLQSIVKKDYFLLLAQKNVLMQIAYCVNW